MKLTFKRHWRDVVLVLVALTGAGLMLAYIFAHQDAFTPPSWFPGVETQYEINAEFSSANGIVPGQGQPVTIAGVQVGDIGSVKLKNGRAVVQLQLDRKYAPVRTNATVLLRPRTPLKDMSVALDPGTAPAPMLKDGGTIPVSQTNPDVNFDEILNNLDADTRTYLKILLASAGQAFRDPPDRPAGDGRPSPRAVADFRAALREFEPLARESRKVTTGLAQRRKKLARVVNRMQQIATSIGGVNGQLATLVDASNRTFSATAASNQQLSTALTELPGTLSQTAQTLTKTSALADELGPTMTALLPFAKALKPALEATQPMLLSTTPVLRDQLRPFSVKVQPVVKQLQPAAQELAGAVPALERTLNVANLFFNALGYNPAGSEEGYLFWGAWLSHIGPTLSNIQDAHGAALRGLVLATCSQLDALHQVELGNPSLGPIIKLINVADRLTLCPQSGLLP